jgi:prefoldin subunit 5
MATLEDLKRQIEELEQEKEITNLQHKLDHIDGQIYEINDTIKKVTSYENSKK